MESIDWGAINLVININAYLGKFCHYIMETFVAITTRCYCDTHRSCTNTVSNGSCTHGWCQSIHINTFDASVNIQQPNVDSVGLQLEICIVSITVLTYRLITYSLTCSTTEEAYNINIL